MNVEMILMILGRMLLPLGKILVIRGRHFVLLVRMLVILGRILLPLTRIFVIRGKHFVLLAGMLVIFWQDLNECEKDCDDFG